MVLTGISLLLCQVVGHTLTVLHGDRLEFFGIHPTVEMKNAINSNIEYLEEEKVFCVKGSEETACEIISHNLYCVAI